MAERLGPPDRERIAETLPNADDLLIVRAGTVAVRIHALAGPHPYEWNALRHFGPTRSRFDHHPPPQRVHHQRGVAYVTAGAEAFVAAVGETFQDEGGGVGPIDRSVHARAATVFDTAADLTLLNLDAGWVTRAGGNQAIRSGRRSRSREWARAIYAEFPYIQGLAYSSSVWGPGQCIAVWERGRTSFPPDPAASRLLADPALDDALAAAANDLGTVLI